MTTLISRRHFNRIVGVGGASAAIVRASSVLAQPAWPSRPVRILISFPPGGSSDFVARVLAPHLSERFGQQFIVDNRPGAGGTVAGDILRREAPDGYTFLLSNNAPFTIAPTIFRRVPYNVNTDFTHIAYLGATYGGCVAHPSLGVRDLAGLIAKARAEPGQLNFGSSGVGSIGHITGEDFARKANINIVHIPYRGAGPLRIDLLAGVVGFQFEGIVSSLPQIAAGTLHGLAVGSENRLAAAPNVPTFRELGHDIVVKNWHGLSAPANLPAPITERLHAALSEICVRPAVTEQFNTIGNYYDQMSTAQFTRFVADQIDLWRPMIINAGVVER